MRFRTAWDPWGDYYRVQKMASPTPQPCGIKRDLLRAFANAVSEYHRLQSAQLLSLVKGRGFQFEKQLAEAALRRENAKYAILAHQEEHGC